MATLKIRTSTGEEVERLPLPDQEPTEAAKPKPPVTPKRGRPPKK